MEPSREHLSGGKSWIFEALKQGYQEQGVWGFVGGLLVILGLSLTLALLRSLLNGKKVTVNRLEFLNLYQLLNLLGHLTELTALEENEHVEEVE